MKKTLLILVLFSIGLQADTTAYMRKVLATNKANMVQYLPLNDTTGTTAVDYSGNGRNGIYFFNCTLNVAGIKPGEKAVRFNGTQATVTVYSTSLRDAFPRNEGTLIAWARSPNAVFGGGGTRGIVQYKVDNNNSIQIYGTASDVRLQYIHNGVFDQFDARTTDMTYKLMGGATGKWTMFAIKWSKTANKTKAYINGKQLDQWKAIGNDTITGAITNAESRIGSGNATFHWSGDISHVCLWNTSLTDSQIQNLSDTALTKSFTCFGNSITAGSYASVDSLNWVSRVGRFIGAGIFNNQGYGGTRLQDSAGSTSGTLNPNAGIFRYDTSLIRYNPDHIFIQYGINDINWCGDTINPRYFKTCYNVIIDSLKRAGFDSSRIIIGTTSFFNNTFLTGPLKACATKARQLEYNDTIRSIARSQHLRCADVFNYTINTTDTNAILYTDGLHPVDSGMITIARSHYDAYQLAITSVARSGAYKYLLTGTNFGSVTPTVYVGNTQATVTASTTTTCNITVPKSVSVGSNTITLVNDNYSRVTSVFTVSKESSATASKYSSYKLALKYAYKPAYKY